MSESTDLTGFEKAESAAKTFSYIALPLLIALLGWSIQRSISTQDISKDYVALAVSILTLPEDSVDDDMRIWAVELVNENSPVKFSDEVVFRLKSGESAFPTGTSLTTWYAGSGGWPPPSCFGEDAPSPQVSLDPSPMVPRGESITVTMSLLWEECEPVARLLLNGVTLLETDRFPSSYEIKTGDLPEGPHILRLEIRPAFFIGWATAWETILVVQ